MPELRKDPISGRWVIISIERGKRPSDFGMRISPKKVAFVLFVKGMNVPLHQKFLLSGKAREPLILPAGV
jgi:UDPglucose--hexose-1-phosphate uridylyltransferase